MFTLEQTSNYVKFNVIFVKIFKVEPGQSYGSSQIPRLRNPVGNKLLYTCSKKRNYVLLTSRSHPQEDTTSSSS